MAQTSSDPVARQKFKHETGLEIPESDPKVNLDEFGDFERRVATLYSVLEFSIWLKSRGQMLVASTATDCYWNLCVCVSVECQIPMIMS